MALSDATAALLGAGVSSLASLGSTLGVNSANSRLNKKMLEFQKYQYEDMKKYNSMSEQVKRMRDAGVNPALALGAGQLGTPASGVSSPSQTPMEAPDFSGAASMVSQGFQMRQQQPLIDANVEKTKAEAKNQDIKNKTELLQNLATIGSLLAKKGVDEETKKSLQKQREALEIQLKYMDQNEANRAHLLQVEANFSESNANWDNEYKRMSVGLLGSEKESKDLLNAAQRITNRYLPAQYSSQIASLMAGVVLSHAQAALANTTSGYVSQQTKTEIVKTAGEQIINALNASKLPAAEKKKFFDKLGLDNLNGKNGTAYKVSAVMSESLLYLVERVFGSLTLPLK